MSEIKKIHIFPEFGTKEFNDLAFTCCGGKLKQQEKALTTKEVMEERSSVYEFINLLERVTPIYKEDSDLYQKYEKQRLNIIEQFKNK